VSESGVATNSNLTSCGLSVVQHRSCTVAFMFVKLLSQNEGTVQWDDILCALVENWFRLPA